MILTCYISSLTATKLLDILIGWAGPYPAMKLSPNNLLNNSTFTCTPVEVFYKRYVVSPISAQFGRVLICSIDSLTATLLLDI